jgi:hypothetical protein
MGKTISENLIVIMAKESLPGLVKTRLAPELSPQEAAALSQCFLEDRIAEVSTLHAVDLAIAYTPATARESFTALAPVQFDFFPQRGSDLGQRMRAIFTDQAARGYARVCIVGSDSPDLPGSIILEALRLLETTTADVVLGPSLDGGYYLIAMARPHPGLFADITWGSQDVLRITMERITEEGLTAALLEPWRDIDTFADLVAFYKKHASNTNGEEGQPGARTLAYLTAKIFTHDPGKDRM